MFESFIKELDDFCKKNSTLIFDDSIYKGLTAFGVLVFITATIGFIKYSSQALSEYINKGGKNYD